jgi:hypothetical protein
MEYCHFWVNMQGHGPGVWVLDQWNGGVHLCIALVGKRLFESESYTISGVSGLYLLKLSARGT